MAAEAEAETAPPPPPAAAAEPAMIVSTYPDKAAASGAAADLVGAGLAACVNISEISSFYSWEGKMMEDEREHIAIFKTTSDRKEELKERIGATHPYDVPEIAEIAISDINGPYMRWLAASTRSSTATTTPDESRGSSP